MKGRIAYEISGEWAQTVVRESASGWVVERDSRIQGQRTGARYWLGFGRTAEAGADLNVPANDLGTPLGQIVVERATSARVGRCLRRGVLVA